MRILLVVLFLTASNSVLSADWSGTVTYIKSSTVSNAVLFGLSGELEDPVRCNESKLYSIDLSAPGGETIFELIKYAYVNKLSVKANSLRTCVDYWKAEGVKEVVLQQ